MVILPDSENRGKRVRIECKMGKNIASPFLQHIEFICLRTLRKQLAVMRSGVRSPSAPPPKHQRGAPNKAAPFLLVQNCLKLLSYRHVDRSLQGVGHDIDGVHMDGRIMAGPGTGHVEGLDPVHFNPGGDERTRIRWPLPESQVDVQQLLAVL